MRHSVIMPEHKHYARLVYGINADYTLDLIAQNAHLWQERRIILKACSGEPERTSAEHQSMTLPAMEELEMEQVLEALASEIGIRTIGAAMLVKLKPGGVMPARDPRASYRFSRFHCVLKTADDCTLSAHDESVLMGSGELWWVNNRVDHRVSTTDAHIIYLVFDGCTNALS